MSMRNGAVVQSTCTEIMDYPIKAWGCFSADCGNIAIIGGGHSSSRCPVNKVFVFESNSFKEISPLKSARTEAHAVYINQHLLVTGGRGALRNIEVLSCDDAIKTNGWKSYPDAMPSEAYDHQVSIVNQKLILTGGSNRQGDRQNKVWEGTVTFHPRFSVTWTPLPPMLVKRSGHVAVVIGNTLYCLGGYDGMDHVKSTEYFCVATNTWQFGPELPCTLYGARGVVHDASQQCIVTGGLRDNEDSSKVSLFDPQTGLLDLKTELNIGRYYHAAVLF